MMLHMDYFSISNEETATANIDILLTDLSPIHSYISNVHMDEDLKLCDIVKNMAHSRKGVPLKNRKTLLTVRHNCFTGEDAVRWFLDQNFPDVTTVDQAVEFGNKLINSGLIVHVNNKEQLFKNKAIFYTFTDEIRTFCDSSLPLKATKKPTEDIFELCTFNIVTIEIEYYEPVKVFVYVSITNDDVYEQIISHCEKEIDENLDWYNYSIYSKKESPKKRSSVSKNRSNSLKDNFGDSDNTFGFGYQRDSKSEGSGLAFSDTINSDNDNLTKGFLEYCDSIEDNFTPVDPMAINSPVDPMAIAPVDPMAKSINNNTNKNKSKYTSIPQNKEKFWQYRYSKLIFSLSPP
eukprot:TRINITY_DN819_c0_g3_i1.p1 TRINITY_DN819_c0_g3~~TRINITY_DN819_c0_g3_i1.p1  ORF type:complete len:391 (-),score=110.55 TRINITY_DN819_c0_g3_i1:101-1144(-)